LGKGKSSSSLTSWIFGKESCACATTSGADEGAGQSAKPAGANPATLAGDGETRDFSESYEVLGELGHGGMGSVYKVREKNTGKLFALKVMKNEFALDREAVKRFEAEINATKALSHANMANVYDSGTASDGCPYFVMDLIEGESLADILKVEKALPLQRAINIVLQIADALSYAHEHNVIHRDLKPGNILIQKTEDGAEIVKVVDFGIAKILPIQDAETLSLTRTAEIFGSPLYMSPEQCKGDRVDRRSDIYSLGCLLFECLTARPPFESENPVKILLSQIYDDVPVMRSGLDGRTLGQGIQDVLRNCLEKKPDSRYATMKEVAADLQLVGDNKEPHASRKLSSPTRKRKLKITAFKYSPLLLVGLSLFLLYQSQADLSSFFSFMDHRRGETGGVSRVDASDINNKPFALATNAALDFGGKNQPVEFARLLSKQFGQIQKEKAIEEITQAIKLFKSTHRPRNAVLAYQALIVFQLRMGRFEEARSSLYELQELNEVAMKSPPEKGVRLIGWFYMPVQEPAQTMNVVASLLEEYKEYELAKQISLQQISLLKNYPDDSDYSFDAMVNYMRSCYKTNDWADAEKMSEQIIHHPQLEHQVYVGVSGARVALACGDVETARKIFAACAQPYAPYEAELGLACCAAIQKDPQAQSMLSHYAKGSFVFFNTEGDVESRKSTCAYLVKYLLDAKQYDYARTLLSGLAAADKSKDDSELSYHRQYEKLPSTTGAHKNYFDPASNQ